MTRIWLTRWEWDCCGDPVWVGDQVDLGIQSRGPDQDLIQMLGSELADTVDGHESHHEYEFDDRVRGRVVAVHEVTFETVERRMLRRPGHGAPPDTVTPPEGKEWRVVVREIGNGVFAGTSTSRYIIKRERVPGTAILEPVDGVRRNSDPVSPTPADLPGPDRAGLPGEPWRHRRTLAGWLVDVEEI